jgi:5-(carboxyamino)imidazole ribonucleotide mutase
VAAKAAHLAGVLASFTTLPVIALPVSSKMMGGLDSLLSMVQMPKGVPVATVGIDAAENAAILAAQMLALKYPQLSESLESFKQDIALKVNNDNRNLQFKLDELRKPD